MGTLAGNGLRRSRQRSSLKKAVLINFAKKGSFVGVPPLPEACNFTKEAPTQVFSCEYCKIFNNTSFTEHLWATAFKVV